MTASSYDNAFDSFTVVDGFFAEEHFCGSCEGCFATDTVVGEAWINVQLTHISVVRTVLIINLEEFGINNLIGTEIRVGFDANPANN